MMTIGLDLGGTTFAVGIIGPDGAIIKSLERDTQQHDGPDILLPRLAQAVRDLLAEAGYQEPPADAVLGIGVPGPVKHRDGVCVIAPNLRGWKDLAVAGPMREMLGIPTYIINDANAAAVGEARFGAGRDVESMLMLTLGTGIGSGLILNNKMHFGASERGAEVGHTCIDIRSDRGSCGNIGTVESACGRDAITWRAMRALAGGRKSNLPEICKGDLTAMTPHDVADAAKAGDALAIEVWEETAVHLAAGIVNVVFIADVERVVLGGGVAQAGDVLFAPLRRAVAARTSQLVFDVTQIVPAELGPDAGLIGAAQWARERAAAGA